MKFPFLIPIFLLFSFSFYAQNMVSCNKGLDSYVYGLYNDTVLNKLVVFGYFDHADGKLVQGMATWDGQNFEALGNGNKKPIGGKKEMIIRYKHKLYVQFDDFYLHAYDYLTGNWSTIPGQFDGRIWDGATLNDELYLVGDFQKVGATAVRNIIKFNGTSFDTIAQRPLFSSNFYCVETYKNEIYVGGLFDAVPFQGVAKYDGSQWVSASPSLSMGGNPSVWDMEVYNNKLFLCGLWSTINGEFNPSCASWDGQQWHNLGGLIFSNGNPAALTTLRTYKNKLYVFGGMEYADSIRTNNIAVWNDTLWCGVKMYSNTGIQNLPVENYKDNWYFFGDLTINVDTVPVTSQTKGDTINYLGKYIGNNGKLEKNCFDKVSCCVPDSSIRLYPNPTEGKVHFNLSSTFGKTCELKIISALGLQMGEYKNIESSSSMDISNYAADLYLFVFRSESYYKAFKVIKQ